MTEDSAMRLELFERADRETERGQRTSALALYLQGAFLGYEEQLIAAAEAAEESLDPAVAIMLYKAGHNLGAPDCSLGVARILFKQGKEVEAKEWLLLSIDSGNRHSVVALGEIEESLGNIPRALELYAEVEDLEAARMTRAALYVKLKDFTAAISDLSAVDSNEARLKLAHAYVNSGDPVSAKVLLQGLYGVNYAACGVPLGNLLEEEGDLRGAVEVLRKTASLGDVYSHHNLAMLLDQIGERKEAVAELHLGADLGDEMAIRALATRKARKRGKGKRHLARDL